MVSDAYQRVRTFLLLTARFHFFKDQKETVLRTKTFLKSTRIFRNNILKKYENFSNIFEIIGKILMGL